MGLQRRTVGRKNAGDGGGGSACNQLNGSRSPHQHQYKNESHHRGPASPQKMSVTLPTAHFPLQPVGVEWIHQMSRKTDDDNVDVLSISPTPSLLAPSANTPNAFQFLSGTYGERLGTTHQSEGEVLRTEDSLSASTYFSITSDSSPNHRSKKGGPDPILNTVQLGTMPELYSRNEPVSNSHGYFNRSDDSSWRAKKEHLERGEMSRLDRLGTDRQGTSRLDSGCRLEDSEWEKGGWRVLWIIITLLSRGDPNKSFNAEEVIQWLRMEGTIDSRVEDYR